MFSLSKTLGWLLRGMPLSKEEQTACFAARPADSVGWTPNKPKRDRKGERRCYTQTASLYLKPAYADSQVGIILRELIRKGRKLTALDVEEILERKGNPVIDGGRILRYCKPILEASGCLLQEQTVTVASGKKLKVRWVNLNDRRKIKAMRGQDDSREADEARGLWVD